MAMEEIRERYELAMERIRAMKQEKTVSAPFYAYFEKMADFLKWTRTGRVWRRESRNG